MLARFIKQPAKAWAGKQLGHVFARRATGQQMQSRGSSFIIASLSLRFTGQHFRQTELGFDAEIIGGAGLAQIRVDDQRRDAVGLGQQPGEIQAVKVFPSPMPALVITNARLCSRSPACNSRVRKARNCSHSGERGSVIATRCGSTRAAKISRDENSTARVDPTAPKVAPASREAGPPGSAGPPVASAVCAVDAELNAAGIAGEGLSASQGCSLPAPRNEVARRCPRCRCG